MAEVGPKPRRSLTATGVEGQVVMPFYIICDVSASMSSDMPKLNEAVARLHHDLMLNPVVDDLIMLSVITFSTDAETVVPLSPPSEIRIPLLVSGGGTNYGASFREYHRSFEQGRTLLKLEGKRVFRPCVFFFSDGLPTDSDYLQTFRSLFAYDPQTRRGNRAFPYFITFGYRSASLAVMRSLAYPDFGHNRGLWFFAGSHDISDVYSVMFSAIANTIVSSGMSTNTGAVQIVPPTADGIQFGEAGDLV